MKLQGEFDELEQHLKLECQTSNNLSLSLEQESQVRLRLEAEIRLLHQQFQQLKDTKGNLLIYFFGLLLITMFKKQFFFDLCRHLLLFTHNNTCN